MEVQIEEDEEGQFIVLPDEVYESLEWKPGDQIKWTPNGDDSWTLTKVDDNE